MTAEPGTGIWLASGIEHSVTTHRDSILIGPRLSAETEPPEDFLPVRKSPEIHELALLILASAPRTEDEKHRFRTALDTLLGELVIDAFPLPAASNPTIRAITADPRSLLLPLAALARSRALSPRHLERLFRRDLGLSYVQWRTSHRLNHALRRIRAGASTRAAARTVGYDGADGLIKAAQRRTGIDRRRLAEDFAGAIDAWRQTTQAHRDSHIGEPASDNTQPSGSHSSPSSTL